jgi:Mg2+/citrate symporter
LPIVTGWVVTTAFLDLQAPAKEKNARKKMMFFNVYLTIFIMVYFILNSNPVGTHCAWQRFFVAV